MAIPSLYILFFVFDLIAAKEVSSLPSRTLLQDPDLVVQDVERRINTYRRQLGYLSCGTGNPIDDCWRCNPNWDKYSLRLAGCAIGFCKNATGGRNGRISVVTDNTDNDPVSCSRYQVQQRYLYQRDKEGSCVPCGHVVGCINCLNDIKAKNRGCPVRCAQINQVVKLYTV